MPFTKKNPSGLTARLELRLSPDDKRQITAAAAAAGVPVADVVRLRALGRPVVARTDATTIRELRRLGGLLKRVHLDSGGAYSETTAAALSELRGAIAAIQKGAVGDGRASG